MKIVLDARFWRKETGGIGRYSRELVKELLKLQSDDEFQILIRPIDEPQFDVVDSRVKKHVFAVPHYSVAEQTKLPGLLRTIKPDLVHFLNFNQPILYQGKRVTTIHDLTVKKFPVGRSQHDPWRRWAFDRVMKHAASSDAVIAISRATKIDIVRDLGSDPEKVHIIYESADERFAPRSENELAEFKKRAGLGRPYILFVNQWRPHKGLPELVRAFELIKKDSRLPHQLVITGQPNKHFPEIKQAIEQSPVRADILTPGFVDDDDLPLYYAASSVLAFPSYYEGFGLGILEAMRSGTPVVCTNVSSLPEVAGDAALFIEPKNASQLAAALKKILTDQKLAKDLSQRGQLQAAKFSWQKMAKETYKLYESINSN